ncbi:hypothetical protein WAI453_007181 [Rhynchosporium graminicola]
MNSETKTQSSSDEKISGSGSQLEDGRTENSQYALPQDPDAHLSEEEKRVVDRKLLWKLDLTLIPWLCILYLLAFLDRTNIGNAKIDGLQKSLGDKNGPMSTGRYNATLSIFFVSYSVFENFAPRCSYQSLWLSGESA